MAKDSFVFRPFPPPALAGIPLEYVISQLRSFAPRYWNQPSTADCSIVIPIPRASGLKDTLNGTIPAAPERRHSEPDLRAQHLRLSLHTDYLSTHSTFLRGLFSGAHEIDLFTSTSGPNTSAQEHSPRLLPSSPQHPVLYLPVPDPASMPLLFHWMYFGETDLIRQALDEGALEWEGLARNVEYLGLSAEIKVFLYAWWHECVLFQGCEESEDSGIDSDDEDESSEDEDEDEDVSDLEMSSCTPYHTATTKFTLPRGRSRTIRLLGTSMPRSNLIYSE